MIRSFISRNHHGTFEKAGISSGVALLFAPPAGGREVHVFQGTISRDGTLEKAGTSSGVDSLLFASPAPEKVTDIGPCISFFFVLKSTKVIVYSIKYYHVQ